MIDVSPVAPTPAASPVDFLAGTASVSAPPAPVLPPEIRSKLAGMHPDLDTLHGVNLANLRVMAAIAGHLETLAVRAAQPTAVSFTAESLPGLAEALSDAVETGQSGQYDAVRSEIGETNAKVKAVATAQEETQGGPRTRTQRGLDARD
jgi:hypothetical protein